MEVTWRKLHGYGILIMTSLQREGDTVFDIGGHIGTITVPLAKKLVQVVMCTLSKYNGDYMKKLSLTYI